MKGDEKIRWRKYEWKSLYEKIWLRESDWKKRKEEEVSRVECGEDNIEEV